ncbi:hypothetical protein HMPREF9444_01701 [Succinatimonas hippei YIT 12066]|uniref:Uncharacterized protein n=1 Tax=Succinatimonas hippei (strain DSM 22608 / JCM 16073 / KCTC 15190 / YIT 12066) TaxID=762983 RepID=E8LLT0_SUCHY|nr:hypothetical protein HMPREF9444_01701 [Succinatimonas hippei YIT 12066]
MFKKNVYKFTKIENQISAEEWIMSEDNLFKKFTKVEKYLAKTKKKKCKPIF